MALAVHPVLARGIASLALAGAAVLWLAPAALADSERIGPYEVAAVVSPDGDLAITETITYHFGEGERRGIFRLIPMWSELPDGTRWMHPVTLESVSMDGGSVPYETSQDGALFEVKIGDPDATITGAHVYEISYAVEGALRSMTSEELAATNPYGFAPGDVELYWDFIGDGWPVSIYQAEVIVSGPGPVLAAQCYSGYYGDTAGCNDRISGDSVTFRKASSLPYQGLTAVVAYPGSAFTTPPVRRIEAMPLSEDASRVFFPVALTLSLVALIAPSLIILVLRRRIRGVDIPGSPVQFGPPRGLRPAEIEVSLDGELSSRGVLATLLDLVARRHITLSSDPGGFFKESRIDLAWWGAGTDTLRPWEERLTGEIFEGRDRATLEGYDADFASAVKSVRTELTKEAVAAERLDPQAGSPRRRVGCMAGIGLFLGIAAFGFGSVTDNAIFYAGVAPVLLALTLGLFIAAYLVPDRETRETARFEAEVEGFKRLLDTDPGAARRDLVQRLGLPDYAVYATFLPYAVLFDLEDAWSGAFPDLTEEQLHSTGLFLVNTAAIHSLMSVGASTVSAASTPPRASGGSGLSGGGGFSGGGGGGGGGGSW
jgi:uncharacterized membrane protein YgcG